MSSTDAIINLIKKLPMFVDYEGITFDLMLFKNGEEVRLTYAIYNVDEYSKHYDLYWEFSSWQNPFLNSVTGFLYLVEGITTDNDLLDAVEEMHAFLTKNKLV